MDDSIIIELSDTALRQQSLLENLVSITDVVRGFYIQLIHTGISNKLEEPDTQSTLPYGDDNYSAASRFPRQALRDDLDKIGLASSIGTISTRFKTLVELGIATQQVYVQKNKKRLTRIMVKDFSALVKLQPLPEKNTGPRVRRTKSKVRAVNDLVDSKEKIIRLKDPQNISAFFHERVFNGILDTAMRLSPTDKRRKIDAELTIAGAPLYITSLCTSDENSELAILTDQRAMRPIISYCRKEIERARVNLIAKYGESGFHESMIENLFHLDLHDLCILMGKDIHHKTLEEASSMMRRLEETLYEVDASENQWFREFFNLLSSDHENAAEPDIYKFKFIHGLQIAREHYKIADLFGAELSELRPRFYTFSLDKLLFDGVRMNKGRNVFLSHQGLATERSGIIQRFYNWCRAFVSGRNKSGVQQRWYTIHQMHDFLTPAALFHNFKDHFIRALRNHAVDGNWKNGESGLALIYGYYVHYKRENGEDLFRFERDVNDDIVGDNSLHNIRLRQSASEAVDYE